MPSRSVTLPSAYFNPLPPHGGRRSGTVICNAAGNISIHSLHTEGDSSKNSGSPALMYFNPLPPHGGRHELNFAPHLHWNFNPLPPHGGRLMTLPRLLSPNIFQSTPSTRRETMVTQRAATTGSFQSTPSTRRETSSRIRVIRLQLFQSTPSTRRETKTARHQERHHRHFNPLPPHGGRRQLSDSGQRGKDFNPLPPHGGRLSP